jgi:sialate O-acetylesterase
MDMPLVNTPGAFQADNGTAEAAAAGRYTGGIWLWSQVQSKYHSSTSWAEASPASVGQPQAFSAVCWYTGRSLYERLGGQVPIGLLKASVGGSPIEYWLSHASIATCETDRPQCDAQLPDATFYEDQIVALQPYSIGAIVWDQAPGI